MTFLKHAFSSAFLHLVLPLLLASAPAVALANPQNGGSQQQHQQTDDLSGATYKDASAAIDDRVRDLVSRMTMEEKTSQLVQGDIRNWLNETDFSFNRTGLEWSSAARGGSFYVGIPVSWDTLASNIGAGQEYLSKETRLGIPAWVQSEGIHGFLIPNATIFNSPIAMACSFDPELVRKAAGVVATEALALGVNNIFAPVVDLARELRFGRVEETFGEDPYLAGEMGHAFVTGLQAPQKLGKVAAMVKHFMGFASPEQGLNTGPVHGGEREMRTTYAPPFRRSIIDGGALSIMSAYHSYDGVPAVADYHYLTEMLRGEWGYEYFVMSDAGATDRLCKAFKMCESDPVDQEAIVKYALPAGNDVEMGGGSYSFSKIPEMLASGKLSQETIDLAVSRTLKAKFAAGLFEAPYPGGVPAEERDTYIHADESVQLARQLDAESIVLLENHENVLPLSKDAKIAVIGPMAHGFINYGDYVPHFSQYRGISPLDGIRAAVSPSSSDNYPTSGSGTVTYAQGCERWSSSQDMFPEALAAASAADVAVVVVGTWSRDQNELWQGLNATTGEHVDVHSLALVGAMPHLVRAVIGTGVPTVVVYVSGKPVTEPWISDDAAALVQQFYPSEQGGYALADVLFGDVNPSGKLAVSFPRDVGTTPVYYDYLNSGRTAADPGMVYENGTMKFGHDYVLDSPMPLYEFGYGLSYSKFTYTNLRLSQSTISLSSSSRAEKKLTVSVDVTNTSPNNLTGKEVVQVYIRDVISSVVVPHLQLRGFAKVEIPAGETRTVDVELDVDDPETLGLWDLRMQHVVEPGEFVVFVGSSSMDLKLNATLTVT